MNRILKYVSLLILSLCLLTACSTNSFGTDFEFSFETASEADSYNEKEIYIDKPLKQLDLNASLNMDGKSVTVSVVNEEGEKIWENTYEYGSDFVISLENLEEESRYTIQVNATDCKTVKLRISSTENLVEDKEKPEKK